MRGRRRGAQKASRKSDPDREAVVSSRMCRDIALYLHEAVIDARVQEQNNIYYKEGSERKQERIHQESEVTPNRSLATVTRSTLDAITRTGVDALGLEKVSDSDYMTVRGEEDELEGDAIEKNIATLRNAVCAFDETAV